ncbi:MAG: RNA methyltransferase [Salinivirgaceae bacterium]|nr:RNA methyltransferase [Salinivirgaceae bacterium]
MSEIKNLINYLSELITKERFELYNKILENRTNYLTVALEDIYQAHNASAVLRTCDCFGVQDVHVIENRNVYDVNPEVALGSYKWVNIIKHNELEENTIATINFLKNKGYRIVATTPHTNDIELHDFDLSKGKAAFFFGTELNGLTPTMLKHADEFLKIPMYGFTESFNVSVSASVILHYLTTKLRNSDINWQLSKDDRDRTMLKWLKNSIKKFDRISDDFISKNGGDYPSIIPKL